jgi:Putative prokaryotic signal transducing protein
MKGRWPRQPLTLREMGAVPLTVVHDEMEAEVICGMLRTNGIECGYRKTDMAAAWTMGFATGGPTEVLVDETKLDEARRLLRGHG